jgi:DNA (cytosine-5)-methyltransferase 1
MENLSLFDFLKSPLKIDKPIRLIELFAGVGSQAKALKRLGADFEHYRVCEWDKYAIKSYNAVHGTDFATSDIRQITADELGIVDTDKYCYMMTYSFPCQDLSVAGKQMGIAKGDNTRSGLLWEVERLLNECDELPQVLLMENVTQVHGEKNKEHFNKWIEFLESKGYSNYWEDLNAKHFGVPQNRNRTFMVSALGDYVYHFPKEFPLELRLKDVLEESVDEKFYLSGKMLNYAFNVIKEATGIGFLDGVNNSFINPTIANTISCRAATGQRSGTTTYVSNDFDEPVRVGDVKQVVLGGLQKNQSVKTDGVCTCLTSSMGAGGGYVPMFTEAAVVEPGVWDGYNQRVRAEKGVVGTLTTNCGADLKRNVQGVIEGARIRKLTPKECWRLMGFDDADFEKAEKVNSNSQLYKQAGNSIVVNVLEEIFRQMF